MDDTGTTRDLARRDREPAARLDRARRSSIRAPIAPCSTRRAATSPRGRRRALRRLALGAAARRGRACCWSRVVCGLSLCARRRPTTSTARAASTCSTCSRSRACAPRAATRPASPTRASRSSRYRIVCSTRRGECREPRARAARSARGCSARPRPAARRAADRAGSPSRRSTCTSSATRPSPRGRSS